MKYKIFEIETEQGTFQVKAPTSKVTENGVGQVVAAVLQDQYTKTFTSKTCDVRNIIKTYFLYNQM